MGDIALPIWLLATKTADSLSSRRDAAVRSKRMPYRVPRPMRFLSSRLAQMGEPDSAVALYRNYSRDRISPLGSKTFSLTPALLFRLDRCRSLGMIRDFRNACTWIRK